MNKTPRFFLSLWVRFNFICWLLLANAWEEEDEIVLITCRLQDPGFNVANWAVKEKQENLVDEL